MRIQPQLSRLTLALLRFVEQLACRLRITEEEDEGTACICLCTALSSAA